MAYGILKVDTITFTDAGVDKSVTISGLVQNPTFSGNITVTGTVSGNTIQGQTVSGVTVTGTTANFASGVFTTQISGATVTGNVGSFSTITGGTVTLTSGVFGAGSAANPSISFTGDANTGIYSPGADQVAISTGGSGRLFVDASGNVGINKSVPTSALDLVGSLNATQNISLGQLADTGTRGLFTNTAYSRLCVGQVGINWFGQGGQAAVVAQDSGAAYPLAIGTVGGVPLIFGTSAAERLRITPAGLVGVGTSSPGNLLHVESSFSGTLAKIKNNAGSTSADTALEIESSTTAAKTFLVKNAGTERFYVRGDGTSYFNGSVGIGTTSPGALVEASSATGSSSPTPTEIRISTTTSASDWSDASPWGRLSFYNADTSGNGPKIHASVEAVATGALGANSNLIFKTNTDASNSLVERLRLNVNGAVVSGQLDIDDKIVHTGDTNTAIRFPAADTVSVETGGSERARIDSSGRLLVGTSTGTHDLDMGQQLLSVSTTETKSIYRFGNASGLKRKFDLTTVAADRALFSIACGAAGIKAAFEITVFLTGEKSGISSDRVFTGKWSVVRGDAGTFTIANVYSAGSAGAATVTASGDNVNINAIFSIISGGGCFVEIKGLFGTGNQGSSESGFTVTMPAI